MKLIIVRHGQSTSNVKKLYCGHTQHPLSKKGEEQVEKLALRLKDEHIDLIYSSDLKRAMQTAESIAKYHSNINIIQDKRLREFDFGKLDNTPEIKGVTWIDSMKFPEMERISSVCNRVKEFLDEIYSKHKDQTVLVSCHGGVKRAFFTNIYNKPISEFDSFSSSKNTAVSIFEIEEDGNHKVHLINCIKHLDDNFISK